MREISSALNMVLFNVAGVYAGFIYLTIGYILIAVAKILHWHIKKNQIKWKIKPDSKIDDTQPPV